MSIKFGELCGPDGEDLDPKLAALIKCQNETIVRLRQERDDLRKENFRLAAGVCEHVSGDDYGNKFCEQYGCFIK